MKLSMRFLVAGAVFAWVLACGTGSELGQPRPLAKDAQELPSAVTSSIWGTLGFPLNFQGTFKLQSADAGTVGAVVMLSDTAAMSSYCTTGKLPSGQVKLVQIQWPNIPTVGSYDAVKLSTAYAELTIDGDGGITPTKERFAGSTYATGTGIGGDGGTVEITQLDATGITGLLSVGPFLDQTGAFQNDDLTGGFSAPPCRVTLLQ